MVDEVVAVEKVDPGRWRVDCVDRVHIVETAPDGGPVCSCGQLLPACRHAEAVQMVEGDEEEAIASDRDELRERELSRDEVLAAWREGRL